MAIFQRKKSEMICEFEDACDGGFDRDRILMIALEQILPNPSQPRKVFDQVDIVNLADSIRLHGLIQPISVRISSKSDRSRTTYYCIAGERRLRAFKMLGRTHIPCILVATSPSESAELAIIENIMRKDLNLFELAGALATLIEKYGMTQEELASRLSTSQSNIANKLRLLRYSPEEQELILDFHLTERHARSILRLEDEKLRLDAIQWVGDHDLTVADTDAYVDSLFVSAKGAKTKHRQYSGSDFCKFLTKRVSLMRKKGLSVSSDTEENADAYTVVITIAK